MRCVVGHDALRAMAAHLAASDITSGRVRSSRSDGKHDQSPDDRQMVLDSGKHVVCLSFLKLAKQIAIDLSQIGGLCCHFATQYKIGFVWLIVSCRCQLILLT